MNFNTAKRYINPEKLEELKLKFSYSKTKGYYIEYKVTRILDKNSMMPVSILIHNGSFHDSKIFFEVLEELRRRRIMKLKDTIMVDR